MMRSLGWACEEAESGVDALSQMQEGAEYELILLDVNMPRMTGLECLRAVRETLQRQCVKVMMVTTESDFPLIAEALGSGADEFLMKPFTRESLVAKLMLMGLPAGL